jgi:hypothetical protein
MAHQWKRDFMFAVAVGASIEILLLRLFELLRHYWNPNPTSIPKPFPWIANFQKPLVVITIHLERSLRHQLGDSTASWIGFICGFLALTIVWSTGAFLLLWVTRLIRNSVAE